MAGEVLIRYESFRGRHGRLIRPLIGQAQTDAALRAAIDERWLSPRRVLSRAIVRRGIERGELRPDLDPDAVIDALYHRLLRPYSGTEVRLTDAYIDALIEIIFGGIERR
jgi:hypothetical protein